MTRARAFLEALAQEPNVARACREAGISRKTAYKWRKDDASFREAWDEVLEASVDDLEAKAFSRALEGSDYLMRILLSAHRPERYRETSRHEVSGPDGGPVEFTLKIGGGDGGSDEA